MTGGGEKTWEGIIAISMTLISKIGNNFFQKQPKNKTKQKPAWMEQFKFTCFNYYSYKQDLKLIPVIAKNMEMVKTKQQPAAAVSVRFQHSWINKPKIVKMHDFLTRVSKMQAPCLFDMIRQFVNLNH